MSNKFILILFFCSALFGAQNSNPINDIKVLYANSILDFVLMHSLQSNIHSSQIKHYKKNDLDISKSANVAMQTRRSSLLTTQRRHGIRNLKNQVSENKVYDNFYFIAGYVNAKIDLLNTQGYNANMIYNINPNDYFTFALFASFASVDSKDFALNSIKQNNTIAGMSMKFTSSVFELSITSGFNYGFNCIDSSLFNRVPFNHNYAFANLTGGFVIDSGDNNFIKPLIGVDIIYSPKYSIKGDSVAISTNNYLYLSAFGGIEFSMHYENVLLYFFPSYQYRINPTMKYITSGIQSLPVYLDVTNGINDYISLLIGSNFAMTDNSFIFINGLYLGNLKGVVNSFNVNLGFKILI